MYVLVLARSGRERKIETICLSVIRCISQCSNLKLRLFPVVVVSRSQLTSSLILYPFPPPPQPNPIQPIRLWFPVQLLFTIIIIITITIIICFVGVVIYPAPVPSLSRLFSAHLLLVQLVPYNPARAIAPVRPPRLEGSI